MLDDLELALLMVDAADAVTSGAWTPAGVTASLKADGSPVTDADLAAERAMISVLQRAAPDDGFVGEEFGRHPGRSGRRWIADGIDGTRFFAAGANTWGTLLALEVDGSIAVAVCSSPLQHRRWWAVRGGGAFTGSADSSTARPLRVSTSASLTPDRVTCLPRFESLDHDSQRRLEQSVGGRPVESVWSQQCRVAEGEIAACVWFAGDLWDHAAPSLIVEEAGGRFTDHAGGRRLHSRTAIYSNGRCHDLLLDALRAG
jgi:histidinol-phosphatase